MADSRDACIGPIRAATKGAFSDDEINAIADRMIAGKLAAKAKIPALSDAAAVRQAALEVTTEEVKAALISRRAKYYGELAKRQRLSDYARMSGDGADKLEAMTIGSDKAGFGGRNSVDAMGHALASGLVGDMEKGLRQAKLWKRASGSKRDTTWQKNVVIEMARLNGSKVAETGDKAAVEAARVLGPLIEKGRAMQNGVGAFIGKLEGYVARQNHDPIKVAGGFWRDLGKFGDTKLNAAQTAAFEQWHDFIAPRLDDATFSENLPYSKDRWAGPSPDPAADRKAFLRGVWYNIVTGEHSSGKVKGDDIEGVLPSKGKARSVSAERVLHFKSPGDWWDYHLQYGRGDLFGTVTQDLTRAAQNTALMKRFGPNPEIAWQNDVKRFDQEAREKGDARLGNRINSRRIQSAFDQVAGLTDAPENLRVAHIGSLLRKHESVTKLGSMVLSAFPDIGVASNHLMQAGVPFLDAYGSVFSGILRLGGRAQKEAAEIFDVGARTAAGHLTSGVSARDGALGFYTYLGRVNFALQGFDAWNDGLRQGVAAMMGKHMGNHAGKALEALPKDLAGLLGRYGVDGAGWDAIRAGVTDIDGHKLVGFDHVEGDLAMRGRAMINDMMDNATSEARGREKRDMNTGYARGSVMGEVLRAFMQFKSFPLTYVNRTLIPAARSARAGNVAPLANLIVSTVLLGYLSVQAKELVKGHNPRPLTWQTVAASMVQGGGLGIYGDFLFGERNRVGGGLAETFGGPVVGDFSSLLRLYDDIRHGRDARASALQLAKGQIPFSNLWYTRAALDYLVFWHLQEAVNPGWAGRYQHTVEQNTGSTFWLKPTDAVQ